MKKFGKIFSLMIAMIMMVTVGSVFTSCTNDDDDFRVPAQESQFSQALGQDSTTSVTRNMNDYEEYYVAQKYKTAYKHLHQNSGECSWTSYVLAAAAVARADGQDYPYQQSNPTVQHFRDKISHVKTECSLSEVISDIETYSDTWDHPSYSNIQANVQSFDTFDEAVYYLLARRKGVNGCTLNQKPCIYITSHNNIGHFVLIWDVMWSGNASTSFVNVTDPLDGYTYSFSSFSDVCDQRNLYTLLQAKVSQKYNFMFFE